MTDLAPDHAAPRHVYLVDGSGFIFRAYHALPPMTRSDGTPTSAVLGFSNMLVKLLSETDADHIAVIFDHSGQSFRNKIYDQYKAHRPDAPEDLKPQFKLVRDATDAFNVCRIELEDYEADDLIATYAREAENAGAIVTVVSSDKDLMQLVGDKITMYDPMKNRQIGDAEVRERFGVTPDKVIEVQALCGDSVDNVPGVRGISAETGGQLVSEFEDLEWLLDHAEDESLKQIAIDRASALEPRIFELAGGPFGINSNKQVGEILFEKLKLPGGQKGKTGTYSVSSDIFKDLSAKGIEIATLIQRWRLLNKTSSSYSDLLKNQADKARLSKVLVTLDTKAPMPCPLADLRVKPMDPDKLLSWLKDMEFRTLATRMAQRLSGAIATAEAAASGPAEPVVPEILPFSAPHDYALVDTLEGLDLWVEGATNIGAVAIWPAASTVPGSRPALAGISLALAPGKAAYIPLAHRAPGTQSSLNLDLGAPQRSNALSLDDALARLRPLFEDRSVLKIVPDAKAAAHMLLRHGIALGPYDCTMLMSYVLDGGQVEHGIEPLTQRSFDHGLAAAKDLLGTGRNQVAFAEIAPETARDYAAERADAALRVHALLKARLVREKMTAFYETIERPLVPAVAEMENNGIQLDHAALGDMSRDFARRIADIEAAVYRDVGHEFNIGSTKQLGDILFEKLGMPGGRKGKTGAYGTDASILEQLVPLHPVPGRILEWRQLTKLKSTYADALGDQIDRETGRVHTTYALAATSTGRLSSTDPNLQNIPIRTEEGRKIRAAFVAAPGHVLLSADYSQIELRLAAHVADIPALKEAFLAGHDIHAATASEVFGVPLETMDRETRRRAKAINFGILYGISAFGLGNQIGVTQAEAADYIKKYFERFPGIRAYMEKTKAECRTQGYVETIFGRKCYIPGIRDQNPMRRAGAERQAINAPLQGSAADIIKRAMGRLPDALTKAGLTAKPLLQVHDELLFEVPEAELDKTATLAREIMEGACAPHCEISVPLVVETGSGRSWDTAH